MPKRVAIPKFSFPFLGGFASMAPKDKLGFGFIAEAVKIVRTKGGASRKAVSDLFYKECSTLQRQDIVNLLRDHAFATRQARNFTALLALPSHLLITKNIEIPSQSPKEIREIINLQAGRLTPYSREEVIIDYSFIGVFRSSYTKILLVIVNKDVVSKQLGIFGEAGIRITKIVLASEAVGGLAYRHLKLEIQNSPFCVVHVDNGVTDFGVFLKERQIFLRSIPIGCRHLLHEKDKHISRFVEELKKSLEAYCAEDIEISPSLVVLTGAIAELKDLELVFLDTFRMPVRTLLPADFIPRSDFVQPEMFSPPEASMVDVASALLKADEEGVNLLPDELKLKLSLEERGLDIIKAGALAMATFLFICGSLLTHIYFKAEYLRRLTAKFKTLNVEASAVEKDFSKAKTIKNYLSVRGQSLNVLAELYDLTPLEIALTSIRLKERGAFTLRGEALAMSDVFGYVNDLEKSSSFKSVKTKYTSKKRIENQEIVDFEIACSLEGAAES